jgi:hypothetical protein
VKQALLSCLLGGDMTPLAQECKIDENLLPRLRAFCFPGGEKAARGVRAIRITESGEFRSEPNARWVPFTAKQEIDATASRYRWDARFQAGAGFFGVMDSYEAGHGSLVIRPAEGVPERRMLGPEFDRGEIQRYLVSLVFCPPMLLNHPSLEWTALGPLTLRVRDLGDWTDATVDLDLTDQGCPLAFRAKRPRTLGNRAVLTPWFVSGSEFQEWEGLRVPSRTAASWLLPEACFEYYRAEIVSFLAVRD